MERRQRPAAHGTWDRPQHPPSFRREAPQYPASQTGPQHGEAHPRVYYPDGGAHRTGPWESRPHEAGRPGSSPHVGSELRPPHRDNGVDFTPHAYHEPQQHAGPQGMSQLRPLRPEVFPHGGTRPGIPHHGPMQPRLPHGNFNSEGLQSPIIPNNGSDPNMPQHRAPEPPQGVMQYNAPCDGPQQSLCVQSPEVGFQGRPQQIPASSQENVSDHRRESQEVGQRLNNYTNMYQSGERHSNVQQHISDEQQGPMYSERPLPSADLFHQGGPGRGPEPALSRYSSSHLSGRHPGGFQYDLPHNRNNLQHTYQNEGSQPGLSRGSHLNPPPPLDTFPYRTPSPGIQPFPTPLQPAPLQNPPYIDNPQQGHYHLPPVHGSLPNPSYALHPPVGSALGGSLEEGDLEVPRLQRRIHPHHLLNQQQQSIMHQDRRQGLEPLMPSGMTGGQHFDHEAPFPQHEVPDGRRDPNLMLQHGSLFVSRPKPHIEDNFLHLDKQTDIENDGSADKDIFAQWLSSFLSCRRKEPATKPDAVQACSIAEARGLIYGALRLVSQLDSMCQALESRNKAGEPWTHDYKKVADIREDLEKRLKELEKPGYIQGVKRKLDRVRRKRLRWQRRRQAAEEEEKEAAERCAEKEASIDLWRMQCIQEVEEKKRERELKATADSVLGEVRKKQNDVKKMLDVLKALEKLRKLRKEAAGRKGVCPPPSADETFTNHIKRLRTMVHKRSALYDAEEKTLRVILEGEQEEERQREKDKRLKKEKEKILQKQRELDSILFGDADPLPSPHPLQPFNQYFLQAEHSVVSLVQIRHEWDTFLVPPDHPDGSSIPRGWVVPTTPSSDTWATALMHSD